MNRLRKELRVNKLEMIQARFWLGVSVIVTLLSPTTGEWECTAASLLMALLCLCAKCLIGASVDRVEERIFQHRLEHGGLDLGAFREFRK